MMVTPGAKKKVVVLCPDCEYEIHLSSQVKLGEKVTCPECWAYLNVVNLEPLELAWVTEEDDLGFDSDDDFADDYSFVSEEEFEEMFETDEDWSDEEDEG